MPDFIKTGKLHIGKKIKEVWKSSRLKGTEFAALINKDRQVIYDIFERETIDTGLLQNISKVLQHDFFSYYSEQNQIGMVKETKPEYGFATKDELAQVTRDLENFIKAEFAKLREELPVKKGSAYKTGSK